MHNKYFTLPVGPVITPQELALLIENMLMVREGDVVTSPLAKERARNISAALIGLTVRG